MELNMELLGGGIDVSTGFEPKRYFGKKTWTKSCKGAYTKLMNQRNNLRKSGSVSRFEVFIKDSNDSTSTPKQITMKVYCCNWHLIMTGQGSTITKAKEAAADGLLLEWRTRFPQPFVAVP